MSHSLDDVSPLEQKRMGQNHGGLLALQKGEVMAAGAAQGGADAESRADDGSSGLAVGTDGKAAKSNLPRATLEEKIQILNYYHRSAKSQSDTVEQFKDQFSISTSSFSEWLKQEADLRERYNEAMTGGTLPVNHLRNSKRKVRYKYDKINRAMDALVQSRLADGLAINEPILRDHWAIYARQYGVDNPKRLYSFSHGWLSQFKKRHGLDRRTMAESGKAGSPSKGSVAANYEVSQLLNGAGQVHGSGGGGVGYSEGQGAGQGQGQVQVQGQRGQGQQGQQGQQNQQHMHQHAQQHAHQQNQQNQQNQHQQRPILNTMTTNPSNAFSNSQFPLINPFIRLDNQVNRDGSGTSPNQLLSGMNTQQQQQQRMQANSTGNGFNGHNAKSILSGNVVGLADGVELDNAMASVSPDNVSEDDAFTVSMEDIEKFMFQWCDKFFHDHQDQFPKTNKVFRTFKDSFMREKFRAMMSSGNSSTQGTSANADAVGAALDSAGGVPNAGVNTNVDDFFLRSAVSKRPK